MKKYVIGIILFVIISQVAVYLLGFAGNICLMSHNEDLGITCLNIANIMTINRTKRAINYLDLSRGYTAINQGEKALLAHQKSAKYFGSCNNHSKNSYNHNLCCINTILLGRNYIAKGDFEQSIQTFNTIGAYRQMVEPYILMNDYDNALKCAKKALEQKKNSDNYLELAVVYRFLNKNNLASKYFDKALEQAKEENLPSCKINTYINKYNNYKISIIEAQQTMHKRMYSNEN